MKENTERYKIVKYGQWHWGILDNALNNGNGLMLRKGPNPDYAKPLDDKDNKLLLFKSKEKAQEYINDKFKNNQELEENMEDKLIKSADIKEIFPTDNGYHDVWYLNNKYGVHNDGGIFHVIDMGNGNQYIFNSNSIDEVNNYIKTELELNVEIKPSTRVFKKKDKVGGKEVAKQQAIKEMASLDFEVGHTFDPDDFDYFKKVCKEDGWDVTEDDFAKYFEYLDEIRAEQYEIEDLDEGYSRDGYSWDEVNGMIHIYEDGKLIDKYPDMESAEDAGWDLTVLTEDIDTSNMNQYCTYLKDYAEQIDRLLKGKYKIIVSGERMFTIKGLKKDITKKLNKFIKPHSDYYEKVEFFKFFKSSNETYEISLTARKEEKSKEEIEQEKRDQHYLDAMTDANLFSHYDRQMKGNPLNEALKIGDKIRIINMVGEPQYSNKEGVVDYIDDAGQVHGTWGGLAIIPEEDEFEILNESLDQMREKALKMKENSNAFAILYGYRAKDGKEVELEPEEFATEEEYKERIQQITNSFTKYSDKDPRGNRYGKESGIEFYTIYPNKKQMNESVVDTIDLKWNIGSDKSNLTPEELDLLERLAQKLEVNSPNEYKYVIQSTYEDYGSGMRWWNIICYNKKGHSWQVLNTKEWLDLMNTGDVDKVYQDVINGDYFQDKPKNISDMNMGELFNHSWDDDE